MSAHVDVHQALCMFTPESQKVSGNIWGRHCYTVLVSVWLLGVVNSL